jgi:predicted DNA-binding ribbon-helix-helix protein
LDRLRIIAIERNISLSHLWGNIENIMRLDPPWPGRRRVRSLSAAVRIFVMESTPFR